jgi:hypothetical protein
VEATMPQNEVQGAQQLGTVVEIQPAHPLTPLSVIFCDQVLTFQYFGQIKADRHAPKLFKTEILQNQSVFFLNPDSRRPVPH